MTSTRAAEGAPAASTGAHAAAATIGDLAQPVRAVPDSWPVPALDELFRREPSLRWVLVERPGEPALISRSWFEMVMTGPLGFGRTLLERRTVSHLTPDEPVRVPADLPVPEVAERVLGRSAGGPADAVLVTWRDGQRGIVPVASVHEHLAMRYAHQALHDPLTGLPNRLHLLERIRTLADDGTPATLCYVDLDRFKDVNDHLGHRAGDAVLVAFAARLREVTRADDVLVRLGGDEFAVLSDVRGDEATAALADRIVLAAAAPFVVPGTGGTEHVVSLGASVGVAATDPVTTPPDALLAHADLAMYRAKSLGRGRVAGFESGLLEDPADSDGSRARHHMERRLRQAVDAALHVGVGSGLHLHYQPLADLPSGRITGVEALARWDDDELGRVGPDVFIPLAERGGLVVDLGRWVLRTACTEAASWPTGPSGVPPTVSVNVSAVQLAEAGFVRDVVEALADSGLAAERLCLEITETAAITDLGTTAGRLRELQDLGVRLALDDFGAGHSSLTLLRRLPVHTVKIDRSFVERITEDTADAVLVRLVVEAAHSLGRRVLAEGVETPEQARQLVSLGADAAQGWLFGRPQPASDALAAALTARSTATDLGPDTAALPLGAVDEAVLVLTPDRVITYASAGSLRLIGRRPQELVGRHLLELLEPEDRERAARGELAAGATGDGSVTVRVPHRDGRPRWLRCAVRRLHDDDGAVREVLVVARDVTEAQQAQLALAASEAMFRHAFDDSPIGMALTGLDGTFLRANRAYAALVGRAVDELTGLRVQDLTHPDDLAADADNAGELLRGEAVVHDVRKRYLRPDGTAVPARVHASVVVDDTGRPAHVFAHVLPD